jgi:hypothetical protein
LNGRRRPTSGLSKNRFTLTCPARLRFLRKPRQPELVSARPRATADRGTKEPFTIQIQNLILREPENSRGIEYCPCTIVLSFDSR